MLTPVVRRTYAPRGETAIQKSWDRRDRISAISAITVSPRRGRLGLYFLLLPDNENVHATDVVRFLKLLRRHIGPKMTVMWDRSHTHDKAKVVRAFLAKHPGTTTERFPGYAPELNPDEGVWDHTKYARLPNFAPRDTEHLRRKLRYELTRLKRRPDLLASFIRHTGLSLRV
jgi:transposase